jgi:CO/xanthine dehydrogenase Mo-binding subunit
VSVKTALVGGGFGGKIAMHSEPIAVLLALASGQPVRLVNTRHEEFQTGYARPASLIRVKTGARKDGTILARQVTGFGDGGCNGSGSAARFPLMTLGPYRIPNVLAEDYEVFTNNIPPGAYRAPGAPPAVFAGESNIDSVARALGMDPVELRLKNVLREGELSPTGQLVAHAPFEEALRAAAARIGWGTPKEGPNRGRGIAVGWWQSGPGNSTVVLMLNSDASIRLVTGAMDQGPGSAMVGLPLIVAAELGIAPEQVEVVLAGTDGPQDAGSSGSKVTVNLGLAAQRAAQDVRRQLFERAADELGVPAERLVIAEGSVRDPETGKSITLASLAFAAYASGQIVGTGSWKTELPPHDHSRCTGNIWPVMANPSVFAQAAEVEVDPDTGQVSVRKLAVAQDVGYAINPQAIEGQIEGGTLMGIGQAVYEELRAREGRIVNADLRRYAAPLASDAPEFFVDVLESRRNEGVAGVKGVGEAPTCATPAAVANAVMDAVGARVRTLPLSGEHVLAALDAANVDGGLHSR